MLAACWRNFPLVILNSGLVSRGDYKPPIDIKKNLCTSAFAAAASTIPLSEAAFSAESKDEASGDLAFEALKKENAELLARNKELEELNRYPNIFRELRDSLVAVDLELGPSFGESSGFVIEVEKYGHLIVTCAHGTLKKFGGILNSSGNFRQSLINNSALSNPFTITLPHKLETSGREVERIKASILKVGGKWLTSPERDLSILKPHADISSITTPLPISMKDLEEVQVTIGFGTHGVNHDPESMFFNIGAVKESIDTSIGLEGQAVPITSLLIHMNGTGGNSGRPVIDPETKSLIGVQYGKVHDRTGDAFVRAVHARDLVKLLSEHGLKIRTS